MLAVQNISRSMRNPNLIAGLLLVSSFLILLLALIILIASGGLPGFSASLQGSLAKMAPYTSIFRRLELLWIVGWILQLMGFAMLTRLLLHTEEENLAIPAFIVGLIAAMLGVLHGTFHMSVETWAAEEAVRTGNIPDIYQPLEIWIGSTFRIAYWLQLAAVAGFGWGILLSKLLTPWVGWAAIGWSVLWLVGGMAGVGAPGLLFIMPAVIGAALLMKSREKSV